MFSRHLRRQAWRGATSVIPHQARNTATATFRAHVPNPPVLYRSQNRFDDLVSSLSNTLGPSSGLTTAGTDILQLSELMASYKSAEPDWARYAFSDYRRGYTRNLVDEGNGRANLLILVWSPGKGSPIHNHAGAHCLMKILKGRLAETLYRWPDHQSSLPVVKRRSVYQANEVTYMSDDLGLHRIENPDNDNVAVSLHLYTPPSAAKHGCHVFDDETGEPTYVPKCHFYSEYGVRTGD